MMPLTALALLMGCHHRLPSGAPEQAHLQVFVVTGPTVHIADQPVAPGGIFGTAEGVANELAELDQAARIRQVVDLPAVQEALARGLDRTLGDTAPLHIVNDASASLQLQVVDYGLEVIDPEQPGRFTFSTRVRLYDADGKRVFHARVPCTAEPERPMSTLTDDEIAAAFVDMARDCGRQVGLRLGR